MKTSQIGLIATPRFDSGRWKLRLERAPISADEHDSYEPAVRKRVLVSARQRFRTNSNLNLASSR